MPNDTLDPALAREAVEYLAGCGYQPQQEKESCDMDKIKDGGPAFPTEKWDCCESLPGMSLRDWFAGQALAGLVHTVFIDQETEDTLMKNGLKADQFPGFLAYQCYHAADAMIAAREAK